MTEEDDGRPEPDREGRTTGRRAFLAGAGVAAGGLALAGLAGCADRGDDGGADRAEGSRLSSDPVPFRSDRQLGILRDPAPAGLVAAFDVAVGTGQELADLFQELSIEIERLMAAEPVAAADQILPPPDSGVVGSEPMETGLSITLAVGATLFDDRFGLADRRPSELAPMPQFFNDRLVRPELSHGDLAILVAGDRPQSTVHALHQIVRVGRRRMRLRWVQEGYNDFLPPDEGIAPTRNLMGFRDGTSNLDASDDAVMDEHVWVQPGDGEPAWAVGGSYVAVRVIRMLIEFWATAALIRQEQIVGRHRDSGAPLGQSEEGEIPAFADDQQDQGVPFRSHIRLANPRAGGVGRILRRGFSYLNGAADDGTLDQGLLFTCFQRSLIGGFVEVQSRLDGEPMEDYVKPVGGGFFFALPGPGDDGWLGRDLFRA